MVAIVSVEWCCRQKRGVALTEPNENLAKEYFDSAEQTLDILKAIEGKSNMWLATTKYYCEYFAVYSLLMKLGIRSEIHECTIALSGMLEKEGILPEGTNRRLSYDKQLRIDNQYYLKNRPVKIDYNEIVEFVLTIKDAAEKITLHKKEEIRKKIAKLM